MKAVHKRRIDGVKQRYWVQKKGRRVATRQAEIVLRTAHKILRMLKPYTLRIILAGSIRRKISTPVDIDIVLIPDPRKVNELKYMVHNMGHFERGGDAYVAFRYNGVPVDVYFATEQDWGAQLMTRTGPLTSNIGNRTLAKHKGMLLNQYGLWQSGKRLAGETEEGIFNALGKAYKRPELRGLGLG